MAPSFRKEDTEAQINGDERTLDSPGYSPKFRQFANPAPLGLCGFALTTFVLSLINIHARHVTLPNFIIGLALAYGGLAQFMAGMWEFTTGNTFGAVAFTSYGAFWISFAIIFIPGFGVIAAYTDPSVNHHIDPGEFSAIVGHYLLAWGLFTSFMTVATLRTTLSLFLLFFILAIALFLLTAGNYLGGDETLLKAGGYLGLGAAFLAWYNAMAGLWTHENSFIRLPVGHFPWSPKKHI